MQNDVLRCITTSDEKFVKLVQIWRKRYDITRKSTILYTLENAHNPEVVGSSPASASMSSVHNGFLLWTIDGEHGVEACLTGHLYETGERGMDQGLAHEMAVDVLCFTIELLQRPGIFFLRYLPEARLCPWQKERLMLQILVIST